MTELKPYPEYRGSETEWLGAIPRSWSTVALKRVATIVNGGTPRPDAEFWDGPIAWATPVDLNAHDGSVIKSTGRTLTVAGLESGSASVPANSVIVSTRAPIGYSALTGRTMAFNQGCKGVVPNEALHAGYALFLMQAAKDELSRRGQGTTFLELGTDALSSVDVALPTIDEQRSIALFLDRETAEIDAFVAEQEQLIELLTERRAATISHAVTKGLDPSVPMKDSGIEWMGPIPQHWQYGNIRRFAQMRTGHTPSRSQLTYWEDTSIPWFTLADVWQLRQGNKYLGGTNENISELGLANSAADLLPAGTVVLSRTASVGFTGIMPIPMATSQDFWNWIPGPDLQSAFLWYQFYAMRPHFGSLVHGSTHKTIYKADAAALEIVVPPVTEQTLLLEHLDSETAELDAAIADAREAIALSRERRAALISAAVTGKIDVRKHPSASPAHNEVA